MQNRNGFATGNNSTHLLIDCGHVSDQGKGQLAPWVAENYERLEKTAPTYSEISASGAGFHMIFDLGEL